MADLSMVTVDPRAVMPRVPNFQGGNSVAQDVQAGIQQARAWQADDRANEAQGQRAQQAQVERGFQVIEMAERDPATAKQLRDQWGLKIPDQALDSSAFRGAMKLAKEQGYTLDPAQTGVFAKTYLETGDFQQATQAAGPPKQKGESSIKATGDGVLTNIIAYPDGSTKVVPVTGSDGRPIREYHKPPSYQPDRTLVEVADPSSPTGARLVPRAQASGRPAPSKDRMSDQDLERWAEQQAERDPSSYVPEVDPYTRQPTGKSIKDPAKLNENFQRNLERLRVQRGGGGQATPAVPGSQPQPTPGPAAPPAAPFSGRYSATGPNGVKVYSDDGVTWHDQNGKVVQ